MILEITCDNTFIFQLNAKGLFDLEVGYKRAEDSNIGDENGITNAKNFADLCSKSKLNELSAGRKSAVC